MITELKRLALEGAHQKPVKVSTARVGKLLETSPQTASRRLQELERAGLISRNIVPDGQWVSITSQGMKMLRQESSDYQRLFGAAEEKVELAGRVRTGLGEGQYYISREGYMRQFREKLGFPPFHGTLNLDLDRPSVLLRRRLDARPGIPIAEFQSEGRTFGGAKCFRAQANSHEVAVILPDRTHYPPDVLELLAPVNLRQALKVKDEDEVRVEVFL